MANAPVYRVQVYDFLDTTNYGIGALLAEFRPLNVGWADYVNDVPESFFTVDQDDTKLALVRGKQGKAHVRILRDDTIVWAGLWGLELDANERDVIFYCYGYLAALYWLQSDWNKQYTTATQVDTIVSDLWTRAKTTLTHSNVGFVTTGTIEAPVTTSGGATPLTLPSYGLYYKRILTALRELAAFSMSDTTNTIVFEITHASSPTFNFWKNRGRDQSSTVVWQYGDGYVAGFRDYQMPIIRRNDILAVGSAPNNSLLRYEYTTSGDITAAGRRAEPIYFQWVRDSTEIARVSSLRGAMAQRDNVDLSFRFHPNVIAPPPIGSWRLADQVKAIVDRGITSLNAKFQIVGVQVLYLNGDESVHALMQQPSGL